MAGIPIVIVTKNGLPVTLASNGRGAPMTVATYGLPVQVVASGGMPVTGFTVGPDVTAPIITSSNTISQPENTALVHFLTANEAVTWAKVGGADSAKFTLGTGGTAGQLSLPAKDYEVPDDANADRAYIVQVQATDAAANPSAIQTITVTITDVSDAGADAAETTAFLARVSGAGHTLTANEIAVYKYLINGLVADGNFTKLPAIYFLATLNEPVAQMNLRSTSYTLVKNGTLSFAADTGYTGDGSTGYLDTQWIPDTNGASSLNSIAIGAYIQSVTASSTSVVMGTNTGGGSAFLYIVPVQSGSFFYGVNDATFGSFANGVPKGAWIATRTSATNTAVYQNAATTAVSSTTSNSVALSATSMLLFARHDNLLIAGHCPYQASAFFIADVGLTNTQAFAINNRINTALGMLTVPKNVY